MENNLPNLTPRLKTVMNFVRPGRTVADIGTDHAYLPVFLVNSGISPNAVASDVKEGPLSRAKLTAKNYRAAEKIKFLLSDGLDKIKESEADEIIIAGMGGELISEIISKCEWIKNPQKHLILQPMTAQEQLRSFLCQNGFAIEKESAAVEKHGKKCYLIMSVFYDGKVREADEFYCLTGELKSGGENERAYLNRTVTALLKKANGISMSKIINEEDEREAENTRKLAEKIKALCGKMNTNR